LITGFSDIVDIKQSPTILICGHGGRDMRCGVMGPVLRAEFQRVLEERGFSTNITNNNNNNNNRNIHEKKNDEKRPGDGDVQVDGPDHANLALISHIGGHKYAGNVIVYIPPGLMTTTASSSSSSSFSSFSSSTSSTTTSSSVSAAPHPLSGKGIWYGRVEPKHVEGIIEETIFKGRVVADHFRGGIGMEGEIYRL
jgi:hypothetical protein